MSTRSSRVLHRTFLTCILFVLLLVPQIGITRTALAAKPKTNSAPSSIQSIPNPYCLNLGLSYAFPGSVVSVANPPGQVVSFTFVIALANNCGTTLMSGATVTATGTVTCPDANSTPQPSPPVSHSFDQPIVDGQSNTVPGTDQAYCVVQNNGVPVQASCQQVSPFQSRALVPILMGHCYRHLQ